MDESGLESSDINSLILYELNIYALLIMTLIFPMRYREPSRVIQRIKDGYFAKLGVNTLALMPTAEVSTKQGLGYGLYLYGY